MIRNIILIIVSLVVLAKSLAAMLVWLGGSQPSWQISARNSPQGIVVEVYKSNADEPTFKTVLAGQVISTEFERVTRLELLGEVGQTTFYDETLRPGRWTVVLIKTEIDIMERAMIVEGSTEIPPKN